MNIATLTDFFLWCCIINGGLMLYWFLVCIVAPDLVYKLQSKFFPMPREVFVPILYGFLGLFKIFFIMFNLAPYLALLIIS